MMNKIIVTTESQLSEFITRAIYSGLSQVLAATTPSQPVHNSHPEILNVEQAAELLGLAVSTVYGKASKKELPHSKKHGKLRFKRTQLLEWIDSGEMKTLDQLEQGVSIYTRKSSNS